MMSQAVPAWLRRSLSPTVSIEFDDIVYSLQSFGGISSTGAR